MGFTDPIDTSIPVQNEALTKGDNRIRETKSGIQQLLSIDHEASLTGTTINSIDSGCHNKTTLLEQAVDASPPSGVTTNFGILYTKLDSDTSQSELFWIDENSNVLQFTKGNTVVLDLNFLSNNTFLEGNKVGEASSIGMIKVDTSDQVEIFHTVAKPATLTDDSPPLADKDISNKKYIDDQITALEIKDITGSYDSGSWAACGTGTTSTLTHSLGNTLLNITVLFSVSSDGSNPTRLDSQHDSGNIRGCIVQNITNTQLTVQFAENHAGYTFNTSGVTQLHTTGYFRVLATRIA